MMTSSEARATIKLEKIEKRVRAAQLRECSLHKAESDENAGGSFGGGGAWTRLENWNDCFIANARRRSCCAGLHPCQRESHAKRPFAITEAVVRKKQNLEYLRVGCLRLAIPLCLAFRISLVSPVHCVQRILQPDWSVVERHGFRREH
ncbi:MAG: hypothetical protein ACI9VS_001331 [Candidatus Binatia bacterium]|jgi:hypothetical protein